MGFDLGGALSGGFGGFLSSGGNPLAAGFGALTGGFADNDPKRPETIQNSQTQSNTNQSTNQSTIGTVNQTGQVRGSTTSQTGPAAFQLPYIQQLLAGAQQSYLNPNSQIAGFTPAQQQGQNMLLEQAAPQIGQLAQQTGQTQSFLANPALLNPNSNPYLAASAQASLNPLINSLTRQIFPNIAGGAQAVNAVGSSRQGIAEGNAINQFQQTAGDMLSNQFSNAYQQGLGTMLAAQSQAPQLAQLMQQPGNIFNQVGALQQAQNQNQLNEEQMRLQQFQNLVGSQLYGSQGATTNQQDTASNQIANQQMNQNINKSVDSTTIGNVLGPQAEGNPLAPLGTGLALGDLLNRYNPFANFGAPINPYDNSINGWTNTVGR